MPIYEYECKKCGERFETLVRASEQPRCPNCASKSLKKLLSGFSTTSGTRRRLSSSAPCCESPTECRGCCHRCKM